jgi:hypothetical protein
LATPSERWKSGLSAVLVKLPAARLVVGGLDLVDDLVLADHQALESGGDAEQVAHALAAALPVDVLVEDGGIDAMVLGQHADDGLAVGRAGEVAFQAVAGAQHHRFAGPRQGREPGQQLGHALGRHGEAFADVDRGAMMVDAQDRQRQIAAGISGSGIPLTHACTPAG